jgi:hypothetical protein
MLDMIVRIGVWIGIGSMVWVWRFMAFIIPGVRGHLLM